VAVTLRCCSKLERKKPTQAFASHVTRNTSHGTHHTSHVTSHKSQVTSHTSHVTRHTSHVTRQICNTSHVRRRTSHVTNTRHTSPHSFLKTESKTRTASKHAIRLMMYFHMNLRLVAVGHIRRRCKVPARAARARHHFNNNVPATLNHRIHTPKPSSQWRFKGTKQSRLQYGHVFPNCSHFSIQSYSANEMKPIAQEAASERATVVFWSALRITV
jgi:hypothetical protein